MSVESITRTICDSCGKTDCRPGSNSQPPMEWAHVSININKKLNSWENSVRREFILCDKCVCKVQNFIQAGGKMTRVK